MSSLKSRESLAVKYRPKRLEQFIGQDDIVNILKGQFKSKAGINRSFLIHGSTGNGKTSLARVMAHYINCENFNFESCAPCGECPYCLAVDAKNYYSGVEEINFSDTRGIDTVRSIIDSTAYAPQHNAHVFICDEIQCLTNAAQNALLKILEEPPEGVIFILLTTDPNRLLPTIRNRCCSLPVEKVEVNDLAQYLIKVCTTEKRNYFVPEDKTKEAFEKSYTVFKNIALLSRGHVRQALSTLEAILSMIEGGEKIDTQDVDVVKKIVNKFNLDTPDVDFNIAAYLIEGVYSGKYGLALSYALALTQQSQSVKQLFDKITDYHLQTLYFLCDPNKKVANLCDAFYGHWHTSLITAAKSGSLYVTHIAAAEMVNVFMDLISHLNQYTHDERRLAIAYTLKLIEIVQKHKNASYTKASVFHKTHAPQLLRD